MFNCVMCLYTHVMNRPGIAVQSPADAQARKRKARVIAPGRDEEPVSIEETQHLRK